MKRNKRDQKLFLKRTGNENKKFFTYNRSFDLFFISFSGKFHNRTE